MNCPKCSYVNPEGAKFCIECGTALMERPALADKSVHLSERKRITALFPDLSDYTAMTGKLDPEEVKEITSRIFDKTREIIKKHEGFIELFSDDGFLALFGVPKAHEDDPIRAILVALETRFLCGISFPRLVEYKARKMPGFGRLEAWPYKSVEKWVRLNHM